MEKTISYLNSKIWYRILKVIFIFCFLGIFFFINFLLNVEGIKTINQNSSVITCNFGTKLSFSPNDVDISLSKYDFKDGKLKYSYFIEYNSYEFNKILKKCNENDLSKMNPYIIQRGYELKYGTGSNLSEEERKNQFAQDAKLIRNAYSYDKEKYVDFSLQIFDIKPNFTYFPFIRDIILSLISLLIIFEIIRRVFYYILLGTIKPKK